MSASLQRLTQIIQRLYHGERLKISELSKDFGVSTKTIQRDLKERLKSPFLLKEGHCFFLSPQAHSDDFILDILYNLFPHCTDSFSLKLNNILNKYQAIKNDAFFLSLQAQDLTSKLHEILTIQKAIQKCSQIKLLYKQTLLTHLQPLKIAAINGSWFLLALQEDQRLYLSLQDLSNVKLERNRFLPSTQAQRRFEVDFFDTPRVLISLLISPQAAEIFKQKKLAAHQKLIEDGEGNLILECLSNNLEGIEALILQHLPHVVVLEPQELKERIEEKVRLYALRCKLI